MSQQIFDPNMFLDITVDQPFEDRIPLPVISRNMFGSKIC